MRDPDGPEAPDLGQGAPDLGQEALDLRHEATAHLRGSALLLTGRVLSLGFGFVTQVVIVRSLSASAFGAFAYAMSWVALGQLFCGLGLQRSLGLFLGRYDHDGDDARVLGLLRLVSLTIVASAGVLVVTVLAGQALTGGHLLDDRLASSLLAILVVLAPLQGGDDLVSGLLAYLGKARAIFVRQYLLEPGFKLVVVAVLVLTGSHVRTLALGYVLASSVGLLLYGQALRSALDERGLRERMRGLRPIVPWGQVFSYTLPLLTTDLVAVCFTSVDGVLLGHYRDGSAVGALRVIAPLAALNLLVFTSFTLLYAPAASRLHARGDLDAVADLYWRTTTWIAVLTFPVLAVTTVLAEPLTTLLFGQRYATSSTYLVLLSVGSYVSAAIGFNGLTTRVFGLLRFTLVVNALAVVVNLGLGLVLIPRYGALGAALAVGLSLTVHNLLKQVGLRRCLGRAFPPRRFGVPFLAIAGGACVLGASHLVWGNAVLPSLLAATVSSVVVGAAGLRTLDIGEVWHRTPR